MNRTTQVVTETKRHKDNRTTREKAKIWGFFGILLMINVLAWLAGHKAPWQQWSMWVIMIVGVIDTFVLIVFIQAKGSGGQSTSSSRHSNKKPDHYDLFLNPSLDSTYGSMRPDNEKE